MPSHLLNSRTPIFGEHIPIFFDLLGLMKNYLRQAVVGIWLEALCGPSEQVWVATSLETAQRTPAQGMKGFPDAKTSTVTLQGRWQSLGDTLSRFWTLEPTSSLENFTESSLEIGQSFILFLQ